jgi:hypothetical protein
LIEGPADSQAAGPEHWKELRARDAAAFCRSWLAIQVGWIGGVRCAAVARRRPGAAIESLASWPEAAAPSLGEIVERSFAERRDVAVAVARDPDAGRFAVSHHASVAGDEWVVAVEVGRGDESELSEVLRQLQWGAAWLETRRGARPATGPAAADALLELIAATLDVASFREATHALVTRLAHRLGCDRVSLGFSDGRATRVEALSHSAEFGREMNLLRDIAAAMDEARDQAAPIRHPDDRGHVAREHERLAREHGAAAVLSLPLPELGESGGALTLERAGGAFTDAEIELCAAVGAAVAPVLELWRRDGRSLPGVFRDRLREQLRRLVGPGHLGRKLALAIALVLVLFFSFATGEYRVSGEGRLEGSSRRAIVAPFDGYVSAADRRAGDVVPAGSLLAVLDDRELTLERLKWASRLAQFQRQYDDARAAREYGRANVLVAQVEEAKAELARMEERLSRTRITAPFDGLLVSGDLTQSLGAAVSRGEVLFELSPLDQYRVILRVDEEQIADVEVGQRGSLLLAALPDEPVAFEVSKVTPVAVAEEGRNAFRVEGVLDEAGERLRPGMEGVGKIEIDRRNLLWIFTRGLRAWLELRVWSILP